MGFFSKTGRFLAYPIIRPLEQMRDSSAQVRGDYANLKAIKEKRRAQIEAQRIAHIQRINDPQWQGYKATDEEILDPLKIKDPYLRFDVVCDSQGVTQEQLQLQRLALCRSKRVASYLACLFFAGGVLSLAFLPVLLMILMVFISFVGAVFSVLMAFMYALMQSQIEQRKLLHYSEMLARTDFFPYLFKGVESVKV